jgi:hypothetical protein
MYVKTSYVYKYFVGFSALVLIVFPKKSRPFTTLNRWAPLQVVVIWLAFDLHRLTLKMPTARVDSHPDGVKPVAVKTKPGASWKAHETHVLPKNRINIVCS